jgi:hypothetical protein
VHPKQVLTFLRLLDLPVGLLINFSAATMKEGIHRVVKNYKPSFSAPPRLRVNQKTRNARRSDGKMMAAVDPGLLSFPISLIPKILDIPLHFR